MKFKTLLVILALLLSFSTCKSPSSSKSPEPTKGPGTITGTIDEAGTGSAVSGASVSTVPVTTTATTNAQGTYTLSNVPPGSYTLTATAEGYIEHSMSITVTAGQTTTADLTLQADYSGSWSGTTSQGEDVSFTVEDNALTIFKFGYRWKVSGLKMTGSSAVSYIPPLSISGNGFLITGMVTITYFPRMIDMSFTIQGTFPSPTEAEGTMKLTLILGASGTIDGTWTASKS